MKYVFANWKMYLDVPASVELAQTLAAEDLGALSDTTIAVFPTALAFMDVARAIGSTVALGAQNCAWAPAGAYTGAISAHLFKSVGCTYALVGHSERRHIFGETDTAVRKKMEAVLDAGLIPVLCIGETKEEKDTGKREYRLKKQLHTALQDLDAGGKEFLIAYEPVWAIGTGDACNPADADDVHGWIRNELRRYTDRSAPILYGGSVDAGNVAGYMAREMIDGVLVGSASTKSASFLSLIRAI